MLKKGKKGNIFENLGKNTQNWKYFEKGQVIACDNCTKQIARKGPDSSRNLSTSVSTGNMLYDQSNFIRVR